MSIVERELGLDPGGELRERLHESRHEIVQLCGERGKALFTFLLASAIIKTLPGQGEVAIFALRRLYDVAIQLHWSHDTVKRYVAIFRALGLVRHYRHGRHMVELHIPLGSYVPLTNFSALDELIRETRSKQQRLATIVKTRYILRFGDPSQGHSEETQEALLQIKAILEEEHLEPLKRQRLYIRIADLLTRCAGHHPHIKGDLNEQQEAPDRIECLSRLLGDSNNNQEDSSMKSSQGNLLHPATSGDLNRQSGDSMFQHAPQLHATSNKWGDLNSLQGDLPLYSPSIRHDQLTLHNEGQGDSLQKQGDLASLDHSPFHQENNNMGDPNRQMGDLALQNNLQLTQKDGQLEDSKEQVVLKPGDSDFQAVVEMHRHAPYTYNVHYLINNISGDNVIRKRIAQFLASVLEKSEYENGYPTFSKYLKAFNRYTPEVIGRAFLATMVLLHRKHWRVDSAGATFTNQCKVLCGERPLAHYTLDEVEEWIRAWGHLPYPELIVAVAVPPPEQQVSRPATLITGPRKASSATHGLPGYTGGSATTRKKRTYGLQYTGRPVTLNKGTHNLSGPKPPSEKS